MVTMSPTFTSVLTTCPETDAATSDDSSGVNVPVALTTIGTSRLVVVKTETGMTAVSAAAADAVVLARASPLPQPDIHTEAQTTTPSVATALNPNVRMFPLVKFRHR